MIHIYIQIRRKYLETATAALQNNLFYFSTHQNMQLDPWDRSNYFFSVWKWNGLLLPVQFILSRSPNWTRTRFQTRQRLDLQVSHLITDALSLIRLSSSCLNKKSEAASKFTIFIVSVKIVIVDKPQIRTIWTTKALTQPFIFNFI